jgi:hypothetical protein
MGLIARLLKGFSRKPAGTSPFGEWKEPHEGRRSPRVQVLSLHRIQFVRKLGDGREEPVRIANVSATGAGFIREPGHEYPVRARIMHLTETIAGCQFESPMADFNTVIDRYFEIEIAAVCMKEVNPGILRKDCGGTPHLIIGENNCELYYVESSRKVVYFYLTFFGNYLEGGDEEDARFGYVDEDEFLDKPAYRGSPIVRLTHSIPEDVLAGAIKFVENMTRVPQSVRKEIVRAITSPSERAPKIASAR